MNAVVAYLDPGTGSLLLQAIVGGFSGIVVLGRYLWMRFTGHKPAHPSMALSAEMSIPKFPH